MYYYRITKYNPKYRDEYGAYTKDEWIDISCIGHTDAGVLLTGSEYLRVEENYWNTIAYLLELCGVKRMRITSLEKRSEVMHMRFMFSEYRTMYLDDLHKAIKGKKPIGISEIEIMSRLCLRTHAWCRLVGKRNTFIHFGYDYYMYFGTSIDHEIDKERVPKGIFIENFKSPYLKD